MAQEIAPISTNDSRQRLEEAWLERIREQADQARFSRSLLEQRRIEHAALDRKVADANQQAAALDAMNLQKHAADQQAIDRVELSEAARASIRPAAEDLG